MNSLLINQPVAGGHSIPLAAEVDSTDENHFDEFYSIYFQLKILDRWLDNPKYTDICINQPGEVFAFIDSEHRWERFESPDITEPRLMSLGKAVATKNQTDVAVSTQPFLSADLPRGERLEFILPPVCKRGTIIVSIRKHSKRTNLKPVPILLRQKRKDGLTESEVQLKELLANGHYDEFFKKAILLEKNIVVAGATGSGKTSQLAFLIENIPTDVRIVSISDLPELGMDNHLNKAGLYYPSTYTDESIVTPTKLLKRTMRLFPGCILFQELTGAETYDYIDACLSGHRPNLTTVHADSCEAAFMRLAVLFMKKPEGRELPWHIIMHMLYSAIDIVVHITVCPEKGRHIDEIWFDPTRKHEKPSYGQQKNHC